MRNIALVEEKLEPFSMFRDELVLQFLSSVSLVEAATGEVHLWLEYWKNYADTDDWFLL